MAGPWGGRRKGAGRKAKGETHRGEVARAERRLAEKLPMLVDKVLELAEGVWTLEETDDGKRRVYQEAPDLRALIYAIDRIMGKTRPAAEPDSGLLDLRAVVAGAAALMAARQARPVALDGPPPDGPDDGDEGDGA